MTRYWVGSKPVNYMRGLFGINKPMAAQWHEWSEWKKTTRAAHPVGWWLTEELPDYLQKIPETFVDPFHNIAYYIRNRWHRQTHVLPTRFKAGSYHDLSERLLYGMMESLVDFVEVELAWMQYRCGKEENFTYVRGRSAEAGLAYLNWEITLGDPSLEEHDRSPHQATAAKEKLALYTWWKEIRPNRPDAYDVSGYSEHSKKYTIDDILGGRSEVDMVETRKYLDALNKIEEEYAAEDEAMLIRLVKIRQSLWT